MTNEQIHEMAQKLRMEAVRMVYEGKDGHPGPALSIADIIATLYFDVMNIDPKNPEWPDRDRLILSKGHSCPILYAALNERGYFEPKVEHFELRQLHSMFQGHPSMHSTPGLDMTSGSLGNGIAIGAGMAFAAKTLGKDYTTYVICGDGELQEGVCWEGVNMAAGRPAGQPGGLCGPQRLAELQERGVHRGPQQHRRPVPCLRLAHPGDQRP